MGSDLKGNIAAASLILGVATAVFVTAASETGNFPLDADKPASTSVSPEATPSKSESKAAVNQPEPSLTSSPSTTPSQEGTTILVKPVAYSSAKASQDYALWKLKNTYKKTWKKQWGCLKPLWTKESSWNYKAKNPYSGAYGIPQALPGSKMKSAGKDWKTNYRTQVYWGLHKYIYPRYGTPCNAWSHFKRKGWY